MLYVFLIVVQEFQSSWVGPERVNNLNLTIGELKLQLSRTKVGGAHLAYNAHPAIPPGAVEADTDTTGEMSDSEH